jgi:quinolinate synthase
MATATEVCSLENYLVLPDHTMDERIGAARQALGRDCVILGHHYQRDEVIRFADFRGDSYKLSQQAAAAAGKYIVFCGVHFMAESADVLSRPGQVTVLPDLNAGCSMADMAEITQVEDCWEQLISAGLTDDAGSGITPITYMNSTAAIKSFCGERDGVVCTSSNAPAAFTWAFAKNPRLLFLPDQHLGRNTGYRMGIPLNEMVVWDPYMISGGVAPERLRAAKVILWKGHCSVHQRFLPEHVDKVRAKYPGIRVIVHPDEGLLKMIRQAPSGDVRRGHGNPPGQSHGQGVRHGRKESHHARRFRLPVHHHVPHLAPAPVLGARESGRRQCGQPDPSKRRREALGASGARPDARDSIVEPPTRPMH